MSTNIDEYFKKFIKTLIDLGFKVDYESATVFKMIVARYYLNEKPLITLTVFHGKAPEGFNDLCSTNLKINGNETITKTAKSISQFLYDAGELIGIANKYITEKTINGFR